MAADSITGDYRTALRDKMTTTVRAVRVMGSKPKTPQSGHPVAERIGLPWQDLQAKYFTFYNLIRFFRKL